MQLPTSSDIGNAAQVIYQTITPTPQISWPLLNGIVGADVWVKHENHTPLGAFKIRGGLIFVDALRNEGGNCKGLIAASKGNHGQSIAFAGGRSGMPVVIVVPHGNSADKNAAMGALGATLIEHGSDFQDALLHARALAEQRSLRFVPSFAPLLVCGVATWALELFRAVSNIDTLYVPIGLGSGICGAVAAQQALGLKTKIVGVVAEAAPAYARSLAAGHLLESSVGPTIADGVACRAPDPAAFAIISKYVSRIVTVSEAQIREAMRTMFFATHNASEGAGAVSLAALLKEREAMEGRRVAVVLTGANIDTRQFADVLSEHTA
ncbi:MAG: threonine dehydratase [Proteobacteria bacterium]|nr:threonine dehydratase [Pseudomonadota bacterium]